MNNLTGEVDFYDIIFERLEQHRNEVNDSENESLLRTFDRVLLDHEKFHHGADKEPEKRS